MLMTALLTVCLLSGPAVVRPVQDASASSVQPGVVLRLYDVGVALSKLCPLADGEKPNVVRTLNAIDLDIARDDFKPFRERFVARIDGFLRVERVGEYTFRLTSDDGSQLRVDDRLVVDHDGLHGADPKTGTVILGQGDHALAIRYFQGGGGAALRLEWKVPGAEAFTPLPKSALWHDPGVDRSTAPGTKKVIRPARVRGPGDGGPLAGVHPGYDLVDMLPPGAKWRVGGMDWRSDGSLLICNWDERGAVYAITGADQGSWRSIRPRSIANGLGGPMGLCVVEGEVYVLERGALTHLVDKTGNGVTDMYACVATNWPMTTNVNEYAYGLVHKDGAFYAGLGVALEEDGSIASEQIDGRGSIIRIQKDGSFKYVAGGLRTPNGLALGPDDELFVTDQPGNWVPAPKLVHVRDGRFFGVRLSPKGRFEDKPVTPPTVWMPTGEIAVSPSQPILVPEGSFKGQMLVGDVVYGGIRRVYLEKVGDDYQGCVFRFSQGFEAGVNRMTWGPDATLYVGGIGTAGTWGERGKPAYGLQKLVPNTKKVFEMLAVRARSNGLEIEFTQPLAESAGWDPRLYQVRQWRYESGPKPRAAKKDVESLAVKSASVDSSRRKVFLEIPGLKAGRVVYVHLIGPVFRTETGDRLWSTEAWYTLNAVPKDRAGKVVKAPARAGPAVNTLSASEQSAGWRLLFDGKTLGGWKAFGKDAPPQGWKVINGAIVRTDKGGDIMTADDFADFELTLEWRISKGGNSGIFFRADAKGKYPWETGPEMQVLDNDLHADGGGALTSAGADYALHAPPRDLTLPVGMFNKVRILVKGNHVEYWLNGVQSCTYELGSEDWARRVAASKFAKLPRFGKTREGRIVLQNHGDEVAYRNIKIRPLE